MGEEEGEGEGVGGRIKKKNLQESFKKISFVHLFYFTFCIYFWSVQILSMNMHNRLFPTI
jgi:hypothetical protein